MRRRTPLRIVNYAVNGLGLGHLTRLIAINRQIRRLSILLGDPAEIFFLTSSEADTLAYQNGFAAFKIPSKNAVSTCDISPTAYRRMAKQWVWSTINHCQPDILLVDTFPAGSFQELFNVFDLGQKNVFIYRAVRPGVAREASFQSALHGYDAIIQPLEQGENGSPLPDRLQDRLVTTGEILVRSREEILSREKAREILGIADDDFAVYVSTGGGGDREAEEHFARAHAAALLLPQMRFVFGAGALYTGREFPAPNVTWTRQYGFIEYFAAFDSALTAGGFNTVNELLHVGIPCLFWPQPRTHDDQERRVDRLVALGAGLRLETTTSEAVVTGLQLLQERHTEMASVCQTLLPTNHALDAAEVVLALVFPHTDIDNAAIFLQPELLQRLMELTTRGAPEGLLLRLTHVLWQHAQLPPLSEEEAQAILEQAEAQWWQMTREGVPPTRMPTTLRERLSSLSPP
jgi:UDP-N-acetylglucosamine--N-acetylmuramyl-(pentapeptide) pyrophosphoryl-undecaprenol N-acetylglucosamine transferase